MTSSTSKIKKLESLFQLNAKPKVAAEDEAVGRALTQEEVAELETLMRFFKTEAPLPDSLVQWLAQLGLLYGVPFNNLVVDEQLIANSSTSQTQKNFRANNVLRFFYIDMAWVDSMIDGAISIGTHNSRDFKLQQAVHKAFRPNIENVMLNHRQELKGKPIVEQLFPSKMGTLSGFIMRSPIVQQWPGIEIKAYTENIEVADFGASLQDFEKPEKIMHVLRMERLAMDTMLMIFRGVPKCILIKEPSESVYSGFNDVGLQRTAGEQAIGTEEYRIGLRQLNGENLIGQPIVENGSTVEYTLEDSDFRDGNRQKRVLNITNLRMDMGRLLKEKGVIDNKDLSPKDMGVLFVNSPRYHFFQNK